MTRYKDAFLDKKLQKQAKWEKRFINVFFSSRPVRREDKNIHYDLIMEGFNSEPGLTFWNWATASVFFVIATQEQSSE